MSNVSSQQRMRLFYSAGQDPMLLDSVAGFNALHSKLQEFLDTNQLRVRINADTWGNPVSYSLANQERNSDT